MSAPRAIAGVAACALAAAPVARAQELDWHGYLEARLVERAAARPSGAGGEGRLRWGGGGWHASVGAALAAGWQVAPAWRAVASVQWQERERHELDLLEAYLRWRPVSTRRLRGALQLGAFFPPVSLEHDGVGWTSRWTLTSSALNGWVGEELRTIGAQGRLEWRASTGTLGAVAALFGRNDPAGEILFARGWNLTDLSCGPGCRLREPDSVAQGLDEAPPRRFSPYVEIDQRIGAYAGLDWHVPGRLRLALLRYDNNADGSTETHFGANEVYTWETRFWSLGARWEGERQVWIAQAMRGDTFFAPSPFFHSQADFDAAFVLVGRDVGRWRPALRLDAFRTREHPSSGAGAREHGRALTLALNWRPRPGLRLSGEWLRLEGGHDRLRRHPAAAQRAAVVLRRRRPGAAHAPLARQQGVPAAGILRCSTLPGRLP